MLPYTGYFCIMLAAGCWGLLGPLARFALEDGISPLEIAFWRCAIGGLFFFVHAAASGSLRILNAKDGVIFALFGAISVGGFFACYQYAVKTGGAALASVLLYTAPAWVAVFSRFLLGEYLGMAKIIAICMALVGVCCISVSGPGENNESAVLLIQGNLTAKLTLSSLTYGLLAGLLYSTHYIFAARYLQRYSAFALYCCIMLFGALALFPFIQYAHKSFFNWCILIVLGALCTYGAYWLYGEGLKRIAPTRAAILATFEPVIAVFAAWWIWGESFAALGWAGSVLIVGAVLCLVLIPGRDMQVRLKT